MRDWMGRDLTYLRLSLTERCNLKCIYCREENEFCKGRHELTLLELEQLIAVFVELGITKIRLTGGEPLVRRDLEEIISMISRYPQICDLSMTTNAQGLEDRIHVLHRAGLKRINVSMDSLDPERYRRMTRGGDLNQVLRGIEAALREKMLVKINTVLVRGENDKDVDRFLALAREIPVDVRFIELMPFSDVGECRDRRVLGCEILRAHPELHAITPRAISQPSEDYTADGFRGRIGLINPVSHKFCKDCNRVRVTSDGKLRMCLGHDEEIDLRPYLQTHSEQLLPVIQDAMFHKPEKHTFEENYRANCAMNQIGG